ncbi:putative choline transporter [Aspergillus alliaceus]|uniref:Putative choline transporter n=1 Tax=Petromyces alliaceus TaxID=209559 RepID=A0A5N7BSZ5_PETAA|nr:putative choline transporter [Aspergillus alliaceus]
MEDPRSTNDFPVASAQLARNFSFVSMLGLAFAILNSWTALASSLPLSLASGGPTSIVWGLLAAGCCTLCVSLSLAEFLSAYPNSAGQYYWVAVSRSEHAAALSWFTAWFNVAGWVCLSATASLFGSSLIMNIAMFNNRDYTLQSWHMFLVYICFCLVAFLTNAFLNAILATLNKIALTWSICGFAAISITVLSCASPNYNSPSPAIHGPRVMIACVATGIITSFVLIIILLFVSDDISTVIASVYGPLLQILFAATRNKAGAICLLLFPIGCLLLGVVAIMTTCSCMIRALGRDSGLPFHRLWAQIHPALGTPLNALVLSFFLTVCCGCIYLGSSSAFNALSSATVVCFDISYGLPILIHCLRGRKQLPSRPFALHPLLGWFVNLVSIVYILLTTVLFVFPPFLPVTGSNMNYAAAAVGIVLLVSTLSWLLQGRKTFSGRTVVAGIESTPVAVALSVQKD